MNKWVPKYFFNFLLIIFLSVWTFGCIKEKSKVEVKREVKDSNIQTMNFKCTGYIEGISQSDSVYYLKIDTIQLFTGPAAEQAYNEDKKLNPGKITDVPQGYYIRNTKKDSIQLIVSSDADVTMQTFSYDSTGNYKFNEKISIRDFIKLVEQKDFERFKHKPFRFVIKKDNIVSIKEFYIP